VTKCKSSTDTDTDTDTFLAGLEGEDADEDWKGQFQFVCGMPFCKFLVRLQT